MNIKEYAVKSTKDSAALENRVVPEDFVRSNAVKDFLKILNGTHTLDLEFLWN